MGLPDEENLGKAGCIDLSDDTWFAAITVAQEDGDEVLLAGEVAEACGEFERSNLVARVCNGSIDPGLHLVWCQGGREGGDDVGLCEVGCGGEM